MNDSTLKELWQQVAEKKSCEAKQKELTAQRDTLADRLKKLEKSKLAEQADVDRLEGHSLAAFFYQVIGKMDEKLDKERQEAYACLLYTSFLILICVAIYAVLIQSVAISGDAINSIWSIVGYTVLLCFSPVSYTHLSSLTSKGMPPSRSDWRTKMLNAVVRFMPSSVNSASACAFKSASMRILMFVVFPAIRSPPFYWQL